MKIVKKISTLSIISLLGMGLFGSINANALVSPNFIVGGEVSYNDVYLNTGNFKLEIQCRDREGPDNQHVDINYIDENEKKQLLKSGDFCSLKNRKIAYRWHGPVTQVRSDIKRPSEACSNYNVNKKIKIYDAIMGKDMNFTCQKTIVASVELNDVPNGQYHIYNHGKNGIMSPIRRIFIDKGNPQAPTLSNNSSSNSTSNSKPTFTIPCKGQKSKVELYSGGSLIGEGTCKESLQYNWRKVFQNGVDQPKPSKACTERNAGGIQEVGGSSTSGYVCAGNPVNSTSQITVTNKLNPGVHSIKYKRDYGSVSDILTITISENTENSHKPEKEDDEEDDDKKEYSESDVESAIKNERRKIKKEMKEFLTEKYEEVTKESEDKIEKLEEIIKKLQEKKALEDKEKKALEDKKQKGGEGDGENDEENGEVNDNILELPDYENTKNTFKKYPDLIPQTGPESKEEEKYKAVKVISEGAKKELVTKLPHKYFFKNAGSSETDLKFWLTSVTPIDRNRNQYIVLPSQGLVVPINRVKNDSPEARRFFLGRSEGFSKYLKNGVVELPGTSSNDFGEVGNKVIGGHSSDWKSKQGRYKTHFQKIIETNPGEEIWIYKKNKNSNKFKRFIYKIEKSYNTSKDDVSMIKPTNGKNITLFTCTPVGGISGRWIVKGVLVE